MMGWLANCIGQFSTGKNAKQQQPSPKVLNSPGPDEGVIAFVPPNGSVGPSLPMLYPDFIDQRIQKRMPGDKLWQGVQQWQPQQNATFFDPQYPGSMYTGWADRNSYQTMYNQGQRINLDSVVRQAGTPSGVTILAQWADVQTVDSGGFNAWVSSTGGN